MAFIKDFNRMVKERDGWAHWQQGPALVEERKRYVARRLFEKVGYKIFLRYWEDLDEFIPCKSADAQCRINCKYYDGGCQNGQNY